MRSMEDDCTGGTTLVASCCCSPARRHCPPAAARHVLLPSGRGRAAQAVASLPNPTERAPLRRRPAPPPDSQLLAAAGAGAADWPDAGVHEGSLHCAHLRHSAKRENRLLRHRARGEGAQPHRASPGSRIRDMRRAWRSWPPRARGRERIPSRKSPKTSHSTLLSALRRSRG